MSGAVEIILDYPFEYNGEAIDKLEIKRPKAKHMKTIVFKADGGLDMSEMLNLVAKLSGHPPPVLNDLDIVDIGKVGEVIENFMDPAPKA